MSLEELRVHKRGCGRHPHPSGSTAALLEIPVLAVYPTSAHSLFLAFFAFNEINNLRLISQAQNSDSPASTILLTRVFARVRGRSYSALNTRASHHAQKSFAHNLN